MRLAACDQQALEALDDAVEAALGGAAHQQGVDLRHDLRGRRQIPRDRVAIAASPRQVAGVAGIRDPDEVRPDRKRLEDRAEIHVRQGGGLGEVEVERADDVMDGAVAARQLRPVAAEVEDQPVVRSPRRGSASPADARLMAAAVASRSRRTRMSEAAKLHLVPRNSRTSDTSLTHPRNGASLYSLMPTSRARFAMIESPSAMRLHTSQAPASPISRELYQGLWRSPQWPTTHWREIAQVRGSRSTAAACTSHVRARSLGRFLQHARQQCRAGRARVVRALLRRRILATGFRWLLKGSRVSHAAGYVTCRGNPKGAANTSRFFSRLRRLRLLMSSV